MYKALAGLFFGLYILIATGHGIWFVAEAKYHCIKQVGLSKGFFWGCDKFYVDPLNRMLNDGFFKNFYRGFIWPAHYFGSDTAEEKVKSLTLEDKANKLSRLFNQTFTKKNGVESFVTRLDSSSAKQFVFEINWRLNEFKAFNEMPLEFFKSRWATNVCAQQAEDNEVSRLIDEIMKDGYNLNFIFSADGADQKIEVEIENCYPISYF